MLFLGDFKRHAMLVVAQEQSIARIIMPYLNVINLTAVIQNALIQNMKQSLLRETGDLQ